MSSLDALMKPKRKSMLAVHVLALGGIGFLPGFVLAEQPGRSQLPEVRRDQRLGLTSKRVRGIYRLDVWGFLVVLPQQLIAYGPYCDVQGVCGSSHGIQASLVHDPSAEIFVYADGHTSEKQDREHWALQGVQEGKASLTILERDHARLGPLRATRLFATFRDARSPGVESILDMIFASRDITSAQTIYYQIVLTAPKQNYPRDRPIFDALVSSFRLVEVQ